MKEVIKDNSDFLHKDSVAIGVLFHVAKNRQLRFIDWLVKAHVSGGKDKEANIGESGFGEESNKGNQHGIVEHPRELGGGPVPGLKRQRGRELSQKLCSSRVRLWEGKQTPPPHVIF